MNFIEMALSNPLLSPRAAGPQSRSVCRRLGCEKGFVLGYLLFALAVLSMVTVATSRMIGKQDNAKWIANAKDAVEEQAKLIAVQVSLCTTMNTTETDEGYVANFPVGEDVLVSSLTCPATSATIWDSSTGLYMPAKVSGFSDWKYRRTPGASGTVYFYVTAIDRMGVIVLNGVRKRLGESQSTLSATNTTSDTLVVNLLE